MGLPNIAVTVSAGVAPLVVNTDAFQEETNGHYGGVDIGLQSVVSISKHNADIDYLSQKVSLRIRLWSGHTSGRI